MQINHNIGAMITQHALYQNNTSMGKSLERLSTGLRINRAQDDAAGLAMSEQMRTQIRGLGKAKRNAQDGIAALQIAEGGLAEITNMMQRQRELAIQAANDTLTSTERRYLDMEFQELTKEIARIAKTTDYNGKNMLNWSEDPNLSFGAIGDKNMLKAELFAEHDKMMSYVNQFTAGGQDAYSSSGLEEAMDLLLQFAQAPNETTDYPDIAALFNDLKDAIDKIDLTDFYAEQGTIPPSYLPLKDRGFAEALKERLEIIIYSNAPPEADSLSNLYLKMVQNDMTNAASYTLHIGPNYSTGMGDKWANEMTITYISFNPGSLGLSTKNLKMQHHATEVIDHLDKVIKSVSGVRAKIGTYINRLEYTISNCANLEFNTQDAESRIRDTDFAEATTEFTRNQILVQSATSMLAQANTLPQTALQLLQ